MRNGWRICYSVSANLLLALGRGAMKIHGWMLKRQAWAFFAELVSVVATIISLILLEPVWALGWGILTVVFALVTRKWANQDPIPFPYAIHWLLLGPRPFQSPGRLKELLGLHGGEHLLEIGPATGKHSLPIAASLGPGGILEVLDIQPEMLDSLMRRASRVGIANIVPTPGDAARLPYPDDRFDGAYLISVLGEIPDKETALRELRRVLKPEGYLIVGEAFYDPDFIPLTELQGRLSRIGFAFERKTGPWGAYLARFKKSEVVE